MRQPRRRRSIGMTLLLCLVACARPDEGGEAGADGGAGGGAQASGGAASAKGGTAGRGQGGFGGDDDAPGGSSGGSLGDVDAGAGGGAASGGGHAGQAGSAGAPAPLPSADAFAVDDFEGRWSQAVWTGTSAGAASLKVETSVDAPSGQQVLRVRVDGVKSNYLQTPVLLLNGKRHYFGRVFVHFKTAPARHTRLMFVQGSVAGGDARYTLDYLGGEFSIRYYAPEVTVKTGLVARGASKLAAGRWGCLEWEHDFDRQTARLWLDGKQDVEITDASWKMPVAAALSLGYENFNAEATDVLYDGFVLSDARVGCD